MERLGDEPARVLGRTPGGMPGLAEVVRAWPGAVGGPIARAAWPVRLGRDGTLHVACSSAVWAFELDRLGPELLARLQAALGDAAPCALRFRVGPVPEPEGGSGEAREAAPSRPAPSPEAQAEAAAAAAAVEDPSLRALVARAAAASLERARSSRGF